METDTIARIMYTILLQKKQVLIEHSQKLQLLVSLFGNTKFL